MHQSLWLPICIDIKRALGRRLSERCSLSGTAALRYWPTVKKSIGRNSSPGHRNVHGCVTCRVRRAEGKVYNPRCNADEVLFKNVRYTVTKRHYKIWLDINLDQPSQILLRARAVVTNETVTILARTKEHLG